jgi:adenylate kinase
VNIILFGPPGAGKGTQSEKLKNNFNLFKVSTGDLLRTSIKNKTPLGKKIENIIDKGNFVSDEIVLSFIEDIVSNSLYRNRLVFDGYPRNINQAKDLKVLLKKYDQKISAAFSLGVDKEIIIKRITGRQICTNCDLIFNEYFNPSNPKNHLCDKKFLKKRPDDNKETIIKRLDKYTNDTLPILNFYEDQQLLHEIDGKSKIDEIYSQIASIMTSLDA